MVLVERRQKDRSREKGEVRLVHHCSEIEITTLISLNFFFILFLSFWGLLLSHMELSREDTA